MKTVGFAIKDVLLFYPFKHILSIQNFNCLFVSFKAHEDFVLTVGCAYWLAYVQEHFGMEELSDEPKHGKLGKNIKMMHRDKKKRNYLMKLWMR